LSSQFSAFQNFIMSAFLQSQRLPHPVRITEQVWPEGITPVVSVLCHTYQHVHFIRDAIEGFLMQETTFPVEIIIRDDASKDGTAEILRHYQEKFPQLIRTILHSENQYSQGKKAFHETYAIARGEFIALCEGDDYWISPEKLERQVLTLTNNNYSGVFHSVIWVTETKQFICSAPEPKNRRDVIFRDIMSSDVFISTCAFLFRKNVIKKDYFDLLKKCQIGDWPLFAYLSQNNKIAFIDNEMSCYRRHDKGMWTGLSEIKGLHIKCHTLETFIVFFGSKKTENTKDEIKKLKYKIISIYINNNNLLKSFITFCKMNKAISGPSDFLSNLKNYLKIIIK